MTVIIGIDPHKATHTAVAIGGDEAELATVTSERPVSRQISSSNGQSPSGSGPGPSSRLVGSATCSPSSSSMRGSASSTCRRHWLRGCGCSGQEGPTRTTPTTPGQSPSRHSGRRGCDRCAADHAEVLRLLAKRNHDIGRLRTKLVCRLHAVIAALAPGGIPKELNASEANGSSKPSSPRPRSRRPGPLALELLEDVRRLDTS